MVTFSGPPATATRNRPISPELRQVLDTAAKVAGVDQIVITSGGQPGTMAEAPDRRGTTQAVRRICSWW
jgi:hypothetical protein